MKQNVESDDTTRMLTLNVLHLLHLPNGQTSSVLTVAQEKLLRQHHPFCFLLLQQHPAAHPTPILSFVERQPEGTILEGAV